MTIGPGHRSWVWTFYDGEHRSYLPWVVYVSALHFLYCAAATTLYFEVPAFERFVIRLDWIAAALQDVIPVLWHYVVVLPRLGEREWVFLARHIAVVSLAVNLVQMVLWFAGRRIFRERIEAYILNKPRGWWWNGSYGRYAAYAVFTGAIAVVLVCSIYFWREPLEMRASRGWLVQNGYARSLFFMPAGTLVFGLTVPTAATMFLGLFSQRLRAGLR